MQIKTVQDIIKNNTIDFLNTKYFPCFGCYMYMLSDNSYKHSGHIVFSNIIQKNSGIQLTAYKYTTEQTFDLVDVDLPNNAIIQYFQDYHIFNTMLQKNILWLRNDHNKTINCSTLKENVLNEPEYLTSQFYQSMLPCWACYKQNGEYSGLFVLWSVHLNNNKVIEIIGCNHTAEGKFGNFEEDGKFILILGDNDEIRFLKDVIEFPEHLHVMMKDKQEEHNAELKKLKEGKLTGGTTELGRILRF